MGSISFEAVKPANQHTYIAVGILSYRQHYTHLWERGDPSPYLASSFTAEVVAGELSDKDSAHFIVTMDGKEVGILKIIKDCAVGTYSPSEALLIEKIYLLNKNTGRGIGAAVLEFAETYARKLGKKVVWLDTMQQGPALQFYLKHDYRILEEHTLHYTEVLDEEKPMYILIKLIQESGS